VDGYLLDTTTLSIYLYPTHQFHDEKKEALDALPADAPRYISVVALAELMFGVNLAEAIGRGDLPAFRRMIERARDYAVLDLSHHTAAAYAALKAGLATRYLANVLRRDRPRYVEDWVDKATGKALWVDPINEIEIAQRFIPRLNHHQNNLSSHLHRLQHPASYLVRNDNLPNARPSS
jgi:predicted nucleic acid-binding protein